MTNAIVWTTNTPECRTAINIIAALGFTVENRCIGTPQWSLAAMQEQVPGATTVPQIVVDNVVVGDMAAFETTYANMINEAKAAAKASRNKQANGERFSAKASVERAAKFAAKHDEQAAKREAATPAVAKSKARFKKS